MIRKVMCGSKITREAAMSVLARLALLSLLSIISVCFVLFGSFEALFHFFFYSIA